MSDERTRPRSGVGSFLLGGVVGASAVVAGIRRERTRRGRKRRGPLGLAAFESAPCYREAVGAEPSGEDHRDAS